MSKKTPVYLMYIGTITGLVVTYAYTLNVLFASLNGGVSNFDVNKYGEMYPELILLIAILAIQLWSVGMFYRKKVDINE